VWSPHWNMKCFNISKTVEIPTLFVTQIRYKREIPFRQYLSDKAHSRSLCKGQSHSNYTLYVKQSFMIIVHTIHKVVHWLDAIWGAFISFTDILVWILLSSYASVLHKHTLYCNWMEIKFILKDIKHVHRRPLLDKFGNMRLLVWVKILRWPVGLLL
jgi:hypothetical protein